MRFTIIIGNGLYQELQRIRGECIQREGKSLSLSSLIRELIQRGLEARGREKLGPQGLKSEAKVKQRG